MKRISCDPKLQRRIERMCEYLISTDVVFVINSFWFLKGDDGEEFQVEKKSL